MSSKSELRGRISACRAEITKIQADIEKMRAIMSENDRLRLNYTALWGRVNKYDLTAGDTWRKNLTDEAESYRINILNQISDVRTKTMTLHTQTYQAILAAQQRIAALEQEISNLEAQISAIEEQERTNASRNR